MLPLHRRYLLQGLAGGTVAAWASARSGFSWVRAAWADDPGSPPQAAAGLPRSPEATADALVLLWMAGGPAHIDTFDPKPGRPTGGPFAALQSAVDGIQVTEVLPKMAAAMRDLAVVRSLTSRQGAHERASTLLQTGYEPEATVVHPHVGAMLAHALPPAPDDLPSFVSVGVSEGAGYLGPSYAPYFVADPARAMDDLKARNVDAERVARRLALLETLEAAFPAGQDAPVARAHRTVRDRARRLVKSARVEAFDLGKEPAASAAPYGATPIGRALLLARRLVEAGVRVVHVTLPGWDTHQDNFAAVKRLCAGLDPAWAALQADLASRGLLERTLVLWMGEFGRSPEINPRQGRDHHVDAFSAVLSGGGIRGGQALGASDEDGRSVKDRPVSVPDLLATVLFAAGVDPLTTFYANDRPITLLPKEARPVPELLRRAPPSERASG